MTWLTALGVLVPLTAKTLTKTADGFRQMNEALRARAEKVAV